MLNKVLYCGKFSCKIYASDLIKEIPTFININIVSIFLFSFNKKLLICIFI